MRQEGYHRSASDPHRHDDDGSCIPPATHTQNEAVGSSRMQRGVIALEHSESLAEIGHVHPEAGTGRAG